MDERARLDLEEIRAVIKLVEEAGIAELVVEGPHVKIHVKKTVAGPPAVHVQAAASPAAAAAPAEHAAPPADGARPAEERAGRYVPIVAPMVGTFYRAPKPDAPPFVAEGDAVQTGQTVCVLEAMKMFNEIASEVAGRIIRVLAENGAPVEYGQPLFLVDPTAA
jgi:acetyl-CoA carboxylase biotin carboxyl carrier protein